MSSENRCKKWCKLIFGDYVEVHKENTITNSMDPRTRLPICMGPKGNIQGSIKFMLEMEKKNCVKKLYTQYNQKQGLEKYEKQAGQATEKELVQIHNMNALQPLDASKLTEKFNEKSYSIINFLMKKRDDIIKARQCADGGKQ